MVSSSACCSELTRAYSATRMVSSMTLCPLRHEFLSTGAWLGAVLPERSPDGPAEQGQNDFVCLDPQLLFQPIPFEAALQHRRSRPARVLHHKIPLKANAAYELHHGPTPSADPLEQMTRDSRLKRRRRFYNIV